MLVPDMSLDDPKVCFVCAAYSPYFLLSAGSTEGISGGRCPVTGSGSASLA